MVPTLVGSDDNYRVGRAHYKRRGASGCISGGETVMGLDLDLNIDLPAVAGLADRDAALP